MFDIRSINSVHLEITSKCNAACPQCGRNVDGGKLSDWLKPTELYLQDIQRLLSPDFLRQIYTIYMCGNYGDPIVARDTLEIFQYFRDNYVTILMMHTNGSARTVNWWSELGKLLSDSSDLVIFGLDGLEDTNHLYRQNTSWSKIMENVESFISSGGRASWQFIPFKHNEHQVEDAKKLSEEMGFVEFNTLLSNRFFNEMGTLRHTVRTPVRNENGIIERYIEMPTSEKFQHSYFKKEWEETSIDCLAIKDRSIYIDADGKISPCCWTALKNFDETLKMDNTISIENAVENDFQNLAARWKNNEPKVCQNFCSVSNKSFEIQSKLKFDKLE